MISLSYSVYKSSARCSEQYLCGDGENLEKIASHLKNLFVSLTELYLHQALEQIIIYLIRPVSQCFYSVVAQSK